MEARVASSVECRARTRGRGIIEENEESHGQVTTHKNGDMMSVVKVMYLFLRRS